MTAPLPGGSRRAIVALRAAIEKGLAEAPKPVAYATPAPTMARSAPAPIPAPVAEPPREAVALPPVAEKRRGGRPKLPGDPDYRRAKPWPHMVIDDFLPEDIAQEAFMAFPAADDPVWRRHGREFTGGDKARKLEMAKREAMPEALQRIVDLIHGDTALAKFRAMTGFDDLEADPSLYGGGLNLVEPGGFLKPHADFNWAEHLKAYRTVNVLLYLNFGWKPGDGGELELWADGKVARRIEPIGNRCVIFTTTDDAVHGYGPVSATRRSLNFYLYRKTAAPGIASEPHKTRWAD